MGLMTPSPTFALILLAVVLACVGAAFLLWGFLAVVFTLGPFIAIAMVVTYFIRLGSRPASR